jgi:hypothetical protein
MPTNLAAWIGESRLIRYRPPASKAAFPGLLGVVLVYIGALLGLRDMPADGWWQSPWLVVGGAAVGIVFFCLRRFSHGMLADAPNYRDLPGATANSPTKWVFDVQQYIFDTFFVITLVVPVFIAGSWLIRAIILAGGVVLLVCYAIDPKDKQSIIDCARVSHPAGTHSLFWHWRHR